MPLQNRVTPFGDLVPLRARGLFMGNRGGRFHNDDKTLGGRRWASRQWICCVLDFKGRHREVWGRSYTELFFLDEPTALAAGHRPCFECRRWDALSFAEKWQSAFGLRQRPKAAEMDEVLHAERLRGGTKRFHWSYLDALPDGASVMVDDYTAAYAVRGDELLRWSPRGYFDRRKRPRGIIVEVFTPPAIVAALKAGYQPHWHPTADVS